jgi:hypothetical protein
MEDRELLALAAKAAGIKGHFENNGSAAGLHCNDPLNPNMWKRWHPLRDDGDALRLAVKLHITPHIDGNLTDAESSAGFCTEPHFDDPFAATRRAIVRAAAEIGKTMEPAHT